MNGGVTVREMAAGYTIFANNANIPVPVPTPRYSTAKGNVLIDYTEPEEINAFQKKRLHITCSTA